MPSPPGLRAIIDDPRRREKSKGELVRTYKAYHGVVTNEATLAKAMIAA
jgi:hypothetical protein